MTAEETIKANLSTLRTWLEHDQLEWRDYERAARWVENALKYIEELEQRPAPEK
jgi:hypothetical protein